jgi:predicted  nucleic acid-binding Zn-ribbon protein
MSTMDNYAQPEVGVPEKRIDDAPTDPRLLGTQPEPVEQQPVGQFPCTKCGHSFSNQIRFFKPPEQCPRCGTKYANTFERTFEMSARKMGKTQRMQNKLPVMELKLPLCSISQTPNGIEFIDDKTGRIMLTVCMDVNAPEKVAIEALRFYEVDVLAKEAIEHYDTHMDMEYVSMHTTKENTPEMKMRCSKCGQETEDTSAVEVKDGKGSRQVLMCGKCAGETKKMKES